MTYLARLASGDRHVRAALYDGATWSSLSTDPFLSVGADPADSAAVAFDGETLMAAVGAGDPAFVTMELRDATGWTPIAGRIGPGLSAAGLDPVVGGGVEVYATSPFGVISQLWNGTGPQQGFIALPASGVGPALMARADGPCALVEGEPAAIQGAPVLRASCLGLQSGPAGPAIPASGRTTTALALGTGSGVYAMTSAPDAAGPHVVSYRLDADVASTAATTGTTTASLLASVEPNGRPTSAWFEYGPTTAYGVKTTASNLEGSERPQPLSAALTGLKPGTTYHYRVVADNGAGPIGFGDQTFTVGKDTAPPAFVLTLPGSVHQGKNFNLRLRASEAGTLAFQLADGKLRVLHRWTLKLPKPATTTTTLKRYFPKIKGLKPGRYIWLAQVADTAGNTVNAKPRSVVVNKRYAAVRSRSSSPASCVASRSA